MLQAETAEDQYSLYIYTRANKQIHMCALYTQTLASIYVPTLKVNAGVEVSETRNDAQRWL